MCCRNDIAVSSLTVAVMAKAMVGFNDLVCRPSESKIWSGDRQIRRFGEPTVNDASRIGDSRPDEGVAFIAAMIPTRMPVMPAGFSA